jgi:hypothetical protein
MTKRMGISDGMDASPRQRAIAWRRQEEMDPHCNGIDVPKWRWFVDHLSRRIRNEV